ncbi:MAG TPA: class I SAM-dependent DNA methyltransferase [Chitinophagaceae bacterium]|nr:class I SAM-dependent DNA methyltransferase [Chitinophagaceae bacterium]HNU13484.1 class I SAM-dependent DNA methyltransferase [Chitinophagaceae bacterium]
MAKTKKETNTQPLEKTLWLAADKLRKNMDAAEYKHIVLGLIFLKYISDAFEELYAALSSDKLADAEDADEYRAKNVFYVPPQARWSYLLSKAKDPLIGKMVDDAMDAIEALNPTLKGVLPKVFARPNLDKNSLGALIDMIGTIALGDAAARAKDLLGRVYEYFLGQFALAEGKKGGQFYTPQSIVRLLVEMLEPYKGRVFDPCCGSGGMFVQSEKFVLAHAGKIDDISIYGQESNQTTYRLARMNLSIRGIDSSNIKWNNEGSFLRDAHPDLKADYIIANPPFNDSDWSGELLTTDGRWQYGVPPAGNANFAWVQHFIYHLSATGMAGFVLSNGSLSSNTGGEGEIRQRLVENDLVDCIVMLPKQLFYNTGIPACLWFLSRKRSHSSPGGGGRERASNRKGEVLFIDASELGFMIDRKSRDLSDEDIKKITSTYHSWKKRSDTNSSPEGGGWEGDIKGFCKSATLAEIAKHKYVLTPGRYVGIPDAVEDEEAYEEKIAKLTAELKTQMTEAEKLDKEIKMQLKKIGIEL